VAFASRRDLKTHDAFVACGAIGVLCAEPEVFDAEAAGKVPPKPFRAKTFALFGCRLSCKLGTLLLREGGTPISTDDRRAGRLIDTIVDIEPVTSQILLDAVLPILGRRVRFAVTIGLASDELILIPITFTGGVFAFKIDLASLDPNPEITTTRLFFFCAVILEAILMALLKRLGRALVARGALRFVRAPVAAC
jgi:hypothetical protein